jgi:hypothetical protein
LGFCYKIQRTKFNLIKKRRLIVCELKCIKLKIKIKSNNIKERE